MDMDVLAGQVSQLAFVRQLLRGVGVLDPERVQLAAAVEHNAQLGGVVGRGDVHQLDLDVGVGSLKRGDDVGVARIDGGVPRGDLDGHLLAGRSGSGTAGGRRAGRGSAGAGPAAAAGQKAGGKRAGQNACNNTFHSHTLLLSWCLRQLKPPSFMKLL